MSAPRPSRDYWWCQLFGWGSLAVFGAVSSGSHDWHAVLRMVLAKLLVSLTGFALSHAWRGYLRHHDLLPASGALPLLRIGLGLLVLSLLQLLCLLSADLVLHDGALLEAVPGEAWFANLVILLLLWYLIFLIWTLCYAVALARRRAAHVELEKLQLEVSAKDAELRALQSQVNPHFFFNSLNTIRALIYEDADAAAKAVNGLAGMMRHVLRTGHAATVRLDEELDAVRAYLAMESLRFEARLRSRIDVPAQFHGQPLPPLALQTLVENAVRYGVEQATGPCEIRVRAWSDATSVHIAVDNQGRLAQASRSTRLGLHNANQRLRLQFGAGAGCHLSEHDGWVTATITIPKGCP